ncbi:MAG: amidase family protein, partial [Candidatus Rokuibacteriota bacterium]
MTDWTLQAQGAAVQASRVSSLELVEACLARIARLDPRLRAFITVDAEGARATAKERDAELAAGHRRGLLHGLPLAYKDLC